jgi:hypothetical protein
MWHYLTPQPVDQFGGDHRCVVLGKKHGKVNNVNEAGCLLLAGACMVLGGILFIAIFFQTTTSQKNKADTDESAGSRRYSGCA